MNYFHISFTATLTWWFRVCTLSVLTPRKAGSCTRLIWRLLLLVRTASHILIRSRRQEVGCQPVPCDVVYVRYVHILFYISHCDIPSWEQLMGNPASRLVWEQSDAMPVFCTIVLCLPCGFYQLEKETTNHDWQKTKQEISGVLIIPSSAKWTLRTRA